MKAKMKKRASSSNRLYNVWRDHRFQTKGAGREKSKGGARELEKMRVVAKHGESDAQHSLTYYAIVTRSRRVAPGCR